MSIGSGTAGLMSGGGKTSKESPTEELRTASIDVVDFVGGPEAHSGAAAVIAFVRESAHFLKNMRESAGLTPRDMADALGISVSRISQLESGVLRHAPSLRTIALYSTACGKTLKLVTNETDPLDFTRSDDVLVGGFDRLVR